MKRLKCLTVVWIGLFVAAAAHAYGPLNDTGIVTCGDASSNDLPCPVEDYPGQDAEYGRDVTHADDSDGHAGFSFTKLDANGNDLPANATDWSCVRDNVTGLIWEVKTDDGELRDQGWTYSWYSSDSSTNGGDPGAEDNGTCFQVGHCDTDKYVADVNAQGLCGASHWRLPSSDELRSVVSYDRYDPAIDIEYFPKTRIGGFWSSSSYAYDEGGARVVYFGHGSSSAFGKSTGYHSVRLVRGGQPSPSGDAQAVGDQICNEAIPSTAPDER